MKEPTPQELAERFQELPQQMQEAVGDESVAYDIQQIGIKYKIRVDKIDMLITLVAHIMLGFKKSNEFVKALSDKLEVDRETAESIAIDVDEQVFKKIRQSLQQVQHGDFDGKHEIEQEEVGASPARDSLIQEVENHAQEENPLADVSSSSDYNAGSFASAQTASAGSVVTADPYREVPVGMEEAITVTTSPTPFESQKNTKKDPQEIDPSKTFKDTLSEKIDPMKKAVQNQDPYRESID